MEKQRENNRKQAAFYRRTDETSGLKGAALAAAKNAAVTENAAVIENAAAIENTVATETAAATEEISAAEETAAAEQTTWADPEEERRRRRETREKYGDILSLSRPVSLKHPPMARNDRAAQFMPFAALTGYHAAIDETGRFTEEMSDLSDDWKEDLNIQLRSLLAEGKDTVASVTYFKADEKKSGGAYVTVTGTIKKMDEAMLYLTSGESVLLSDILWIQAEFGGPEDAE